MSKFITKLALFVASVPALSHRGVDAANAAENATSPPLEPEAVPLRPLNFQTENLFAGHRSHSSHSSHSSHRSHYSSSGGGSAYTPAPPPSESTVVPNVPPAPAPRYAVPAPTSPTGPIQSSKPDSSSAGGRIGGTAAAASAAAKTPKDPQLSLAEKRRLQIVRVQIKLKTLGIYEGNIDGTLNHETQTALRHFQTVKGLPDSGLMTTPTLNALGVPAVN